MCEYFGTIIDYCDYHTEFVDTLPKMKQRLGELLATV